MEFLAFSELHADKNHNKSYIMENSMTSWMECTLQTLGQIYSYAMYNKIRYVFFGGDLFEKKNYIPQDLYNMIWNEFYDMSIEFNIYLNTGNHDFHSKISSALKPFSKITNVITEPTDLIIDNELIRIIPYGMVDKNLEIPNTRGYKEFILFTHEDIAGLKYGANDYVSGSKYKQQIFGDWDFVFNGHIHKAQRLGNIINMGSVMRHDFGETDKKYFYHYKDGEIKEVEIKCPEFITVPGFSKKIREVAEKDNYNFFRIDISSEELTDPIFKKYNVFPNIIKIKEKKKRLRTDMTEDEEILKYMEIMESDLDKNKILEMVKELV